MQHENALVSVIVRTKDRPKLLKRALHSISRQSYRRLEVVLINDGGCEPDISALRAVLGDIALTYVSLEKNTGRAHAGNVGMENAKGDYIGFLDDDDALYPDHIDTLLAFLRQTPYTVAYTDSMTVYKRYSHACDEEHILRKEVRFSFDFDRNLLLFENYIPLHCLLFQSETIREAGGFDESFAVYEDWDLLIRVSERYPFFHIRKITAEYNQWSAESQISQWNIDSEVLKHAYLKVLGKHSGNITPSRIYDFKSKTLFVKQLEKKVETLESEIAALEKREEEIRRLQTELAEREDFIRAMMRTRGWQMLQKYRNARDSVYSTALGKGRQELVAKGIRTIRTEGMRAFMFKANKKLLLSQSITLSPLALQLDVLPVSRVGELRIDVPLPTRVSLIIPTKNAGREFTQTLEKIMQQEGIPDVELIVIDSGSSDDTVALSRQYTDHVFSIAPSDFHHAKTRNFAAEMATGEFLVFMVQDAIPVGTQWLYKLIAPLYHHQASAVSLRQVPRSDADLFAVWSHWNHDIRYLGNDRDRICRCTADDFDLLGTQEKRILACLDNVCLGIPKKIFSNYLFRSDYAEDLDLGIRLIRDRHVLLFQSSNAVVHSHNRGPFYFFKRSYVNTIHLSEAFLIQRGNMPPEEIGGGINFVYCILKAAIASLDEEVDEPYDPVKVTRLLLNKVYENMTWFNASWKSFPGDPSLDAYLRDITPLHIPWIVSELFTIIAGNFLNFSDFLMRYADITPFRKEFLQSLLKMFCNIAGNYLAVHTGEKESALYEGI